MGEMVFGQVELGKLLLGELSPFELRYYRIFSQIVSTSSVSSAFKQADSPASYPV